MAAASLKLILVAFALGVAGYVYLRLRHALPPHQPPDLEPPDLEPARAVEAQAVGLQAWADALARQRPGKTGIAMLADGPAAFAARVAVIDAARSHIDAQYYIWKGDLTGVILLDALLRAADRGVRVRLLVDDNGIAGLDPELAQLDAHPNAAVRIFNPFMLRWPRWLNYLFDFHRLNRRMHNKSLTVDGAVAILGGRNIGDAYFGAGDATIFVDLDVLAVGAVVPQIEADFGRYWRSEAAYGARAVLPRHAGGDPIGARAAAVGANPAADSFRQALRTADFAARLRGDGKRGQAMDERALDLEWTDAQVISDDPLKGLGRATEDGLLFTHLTSIVGRPERQLDLVSPYLVPGREGTRALAVLARRGVAVRVLTNALEATDVVPVHAGYAKRRRTLLKAKVALFELKRSVAEPASPGQDVLADARDERAVAKTAVAELAFAEPAFARPALASAAFSTSSPPPQAPWRRPGRPGRPTSALARKDEPRATGILGSSGGSLHAKTFAVDGRVIYVGSFNFDLRSMRLNTEMGLVIGSERLARRLHESFDERLGAVAYRPALVGRSLVWHDGDTALAHEPGASASRRALLAIVNRLPVEWLM